MNRDEEVGGELAGDLDPAVERQEGVVLAGQLDLELAGLGELWASNWANGRVIVFSSRPSVATAPVSRPP